VSNKFGSTFDNKRAIVYTNFDCIS